MSNPNSAAAVRSDPKLRRRTLAIVGLPAVGLACFMALSLRRPSEPTYAGETLTRWVQRYEQTSSSGEAAKAIRTMVSNSLPQLADLANYDPTTRQMRRARLLRMLPKRISTSRLFLPLWLPRDNRDRYASAAFTAIEIAGPAATNAVPLLVDLVRTNRETCITRAVHALCVLDIPELQILTNVALNPLAGQMRRRLAIVELKRYTNEPAAFAFLTNALQHPDRQVQAPVAEVLAPLLYQ